MTPRNLSWAISVAALATALAATPQASGDGAPPIRLAVVVAKSSPLAELSIHDLKRLFMGEYVTGPGGRRLIPLARPPSAVERVAFDREVLGMTPEQDANYWIDRKIRGQSGSPKSVDAADLLQRVVGRVEGSVGYVRADEVAPEVKVIAIAGGAPMNVANRVH